MSTLKTRFSATAAKRLRVEMTDAERKLWSLLRNRQFLGLKFVRQLPIGPYIADFACRQVDLVVELDGGQHDQNPADHARTQVLAAHGYDVIRFWNYDVLSNSDGVLTTLGAHIDQAPSPGRRFATTDFSPQGEVKKGNHP
ncbi:MAG: endonuclease domain-containing protein [Alphaproteobacteria bacterium]|nr:endonuclease domain-containing protein [Alphaproteobacteria bacterium]